MAGSFRSGDGGGGGMFLSPGFRSAAEMAGWDEEALLQATLVVEDTPVRESRRHKQQKRQRSQFKTPPQSTNSSTRKRRSRRQSAASISPVVLRLDEDEEEQPAAKDPVAERIDKETPTIVIDKEKMIEKDGSMAEKASRKGLPCMDRLREELSCAICLETCFEPSTTPCGHSFCIKCLKRAADKCGKRCPKCRQLISNGRSCTVNTVLWNTIQLLFPEEVEARKNKVGTTAASPESETLIKSSQRGSINNSSRRNTRYVRRGESTQHLAEQDRSFRRRGGRPSQSEDAALALRLQREEFMVAFQGPREQHQHSLRSTRIILRARTRH